MDRTQNPKVTYHTSKNVVSSKKGRTAPLLIRAGPREVYEAMILTRSPEEQGFGA